MLRKIAKALFVSRAWIISIVFLAAILEVIESSKPFQCCTKERYARAATQNFEKSISPVSVAFDVYRVCLGHFTHDNAEAIIAAFASEILRSWASNLHIAFGLAMPLLFLAHVKTGRWSSTPRVPRRGPGSQAPLPYGQEGPRRPASRGNQYSGLGLSFVTWVNRAQVPPTNHRPI